MPRRHHVKKKRYEFQNIEREELIPKKSDDAFPKQKQTLCQQRNKVLPVVLTRDLLSAILR